MLKPENISFPVSVDYFTALQEESLGREATSTEKKYFAKVCAMANGAFTYAAVGDNKSTTEILNTIDHVEGIDADKFTQHLAAVCRGWVILGIQKGSELLQSSWKSRK